MLRDLALKNGLAEAGQVANHFAQLAAFQDYQGRKSSKTLARQAHELALFAQFVSSTGVIPGDFYTDPAAWTGVTWGLVAAFQRWLLDQGYSVSTVNITVSTVKVYARLAFKAGALDGKAFALITTVEGYSRAEAVHLDTRRDQVRRTIGTDGRKASKKAAPVKLTPAMAEALKAQANPRDKLLMCLLLDHGLRISEVAALIVDNFDLAAGTMTFQRPKVNKAGTHRLTGDTLEAAREMISSQTGSLFGLSIRGLSKRVTAIGKAAGLAHLSPHDCRHYAATRLAGSKTLRELMDIFGWTSPAMAARYMASDEVSVLEG